MLFLEGAAESMSRALSRSFCNQRRILNSEAPFYGFSNRVASIPYISAAAIIVGLFTGAAPIHATESIAGLMSDGRVITAAIEEGETGFASGPDTLVELDNDDGAFIDITSGEGVIYALREDGTVFAVKSSVDVETVATRGWVDVSRIDYANGELFGLRGGENPTVYDASGNVRLRTQGLNVSDFGIHATGDITLLHGPDPGTWTYTYSDGYQGPSKGFIEEGFQTWGAYPNPVALDVVDTSLTVLRSAKNGIWWQFKPIIAGDPGKALKKLPEMAGVALNRDASLAVLIESQDAGIHSAPPDASVTPTSHGSLGQGVALGVVVLEEGGAGTNYSYR